MKFIYGFITSIWMLSIMPQCWAQDDIEGHLYTQKHEPLQGIVVSLHKDTLSKAFMAYAITDTQGYFKMHYKGQAVGKVLKVRSLAFRDTALVVHNSGVPIDLSLQEQVRELKDVKVKGSSFIFKEDTTTFITSSYAKKKDLTLSEVIQRMPGLDVTSSGKILLQGREVDKFYIEGADLLENRYGVATKNLPHKAVSSVQVLRNHQSKKIYNKLNNGKETAINIKLKNNIAATGQGEIGLGYKPWGRYINATPMVFTKKVQFIGSVQSNNIGENLDIFYHELSFTNNEIRGLEKLKVNYLSIPQIGVPNISTKRYLDNDAHFVTINGMRRLTNETELKVNAAFLDNKVHESKETEISYFMNSGLDQYHEQIKNEFHTTSFYTNFIVDKNLKNIYLKNKIGYIQYWDKAKGVINSNGIQELHTQSPHRSVYNILDATIPVGNNFISLLSFIDLNETKDQMLFQPNVFENILDYGKQYSVSKQQYYYEDLNSKQSIKFDVTTPIGIVSSKLFFNTMVNKTKTEMEQNGKTLNFKDLKNNVRWTNIETGIAPSLTIKRNDFKSELECPIYWYYLDFNDKTNNGELKHKQLLYSPKAFVSLKLGTYFTAKASANYSCHFASPSSMLEGNIIYSHRYMRHNIAQIDERKGTKIGSEIEYNNLFKGVLFRLGYRKYINENDFITESKQVAPGVFEYGMVPISNKQFIDHWDGESSFIFQDMGFTLTLNGIYDTHKSNYLLEQALKDYQSKNITYGGCLDFYRWKKVGLQYESKITHFIQKNNGQETKLRQFVHSLKCSYNITKTQFIDIRPEYFILKQSGMKDQKTFFFDLYYSYRPRNTRCTFSLEGRNLFNANTLKTVFDSPLSHNEMLFFLRERQIIFKVTLSIGRS